MMRRLCRPGNTRRGRDGRSCIELRKNNLRSLLTSLQDFSLQWLPSRQEVCSQDAGDRCFHEGLKGE